MVVYHYDILRDTWIYKEIKQEVQAEQQEERLAEQRQLLQAIIKARFPRLVSQVNRAVEQITETATLQRLLTNVGTAKIEKEVRQALSTLPGEGKEET